jgi:uncharacterized membrane protein
MKENYQYRDQAKSLMTARYGVVIITMILWGIITGIPQAISDSFGPKYEVDWATMTRTLVDAGDPALAWMFSVIAFAIGALASYAYARMFIQVAADSNPTMEDILKVGFAEQPIRSIVHAFIVTIFVALWTLLLIIPGIMAAYKYAMGFYILNREESISAYDALTKSKDQMMGNRMKLFMLDLGYLGWYILGIFTLFILWFWIVPRHMTARTLFFNDVYAMNQPKPVLTDEETDEEDIFA